MTSSRFSSIIFAASIALMASPVYAGAMYNLLPRMDFFDDPEIVSKDKAAVVDTCDAASHQKDAVCELNLQLDNTNETDSIKN